MSDPNALTVSERPAGEHPTGKRPGHGTPETFCIRLWQHMRLESSGEVRVCCAYQGPTVSQDGVKLTTDDHSLMEIWNSDEMRGLRRAMVEGRRIGPCEACYTDEERGAVSLRQRDNRAWEQGWLNDERATIDDMVTLAVDNDFRLPKLPVMMEVETGNLCNLKCRMCNSFNSSLIAKDAVQQAWESSPHACYIEPTFERNPRKFRRVGPIETLVEELAKDTASRIRRLYFIGGEPFLVRELPRLLERLVAVDRARQISLLFVSNGTIVPEWLSLATRFNRVDLSISIDGYADDYDYIRYNGHWSELAHNIGLFKEIQNLGLMATTTVQVNNMLRLVSLFRYLDSVGIGFTGYLLHYPRFLAVNILPSSIRRLAAARLTEYAETDCRPERRALVLSFAAQFEAGEEAGDPDLLRDFMLYTNDLDASRGQSIHRTDPELVELLEQAGYPWLHDTLHAPVASVAEETRRWRIALTEARDAAAKLEQQLDTRLQMRPDDSARSRAMPEPSEAQIAPIRRELGRVRHELAEVHASLSWRVTRPLRATGRKLRRWLPGVRSTGKRDTG
jgi:hypothetical protein